MTPPTNPGNISDEELERLTAPNTAPAAAAAPAVETEAPGVPVGTEPAPAAEPEPLVSDPSPNIGEDPASVASEAGLNGMGVLSEPAVPGQAVAPSAADLDAHAEDQAAAAATGGPTPPPDSPEPAAPAVPAAVEGDQGDEHVEAPAADIALATGGVEPKYEFDETVTVEISLKDHATVPHSFRVGTEPLNNVLNRWAKHKYGVDLNLLEDLKVVVNGNYVTYDVTTRELGLHEGSTIFILYS